MTTELTIQGVHTALVTPFGADGAVDAAAYAALARRQLDNGIHGLVACGTTGETPTLTADEWALCCRTAIEVADGAVPVTVGVGTNCTRTTLHNIERAKELGASAGLLVFPYYNKPNPQGLRQHVRAATEKGLPIVLYHVPGRTGQRLAAPLLAELASVEGVIAVKEATGDMLFGGDVLTRTTTTVLSGDDFSFLSLMAMGGAGVISVVSNVAPAQTVAIYDAYRAGRVDEAAEGIRALWPLISFLFCESNPIPCKVALAEMGLCRPDVRLPLAPFAGPPCSLILGALGLS